MDFIVWMLILLFVALPAFCLIVWKWLYHDEIKEEEEDLISA